MDRHADLQAVGEAVHNMDPLKRLALLYEVNLMGDATEAQLAILTAISNAPPEFPKACTANALRQLPKTFCRISASR